MAAQKVAVIDSDEAYLRFVSHFLRLEGFRPISVACPADIVGRLLEERPKAVILDTWLEDREAGWVVLDSLLSDARLRSIPLLLTTSDPVTANARRDVLQRHSRLMVLRKPFTPETLLDQLKNLLADIHRPAA